jgi:hypothetical protein
LATRIATFAQLQNLTTRTGESNPPDMRSYRPGMVVPGCFEKYEAVPRCKPCPLRIDCMMATP